MLGGTPSIKGLRNGKEEMVPAAITDVGCEREINEDRYAVIDSQYGRAWVVCDGMGGVMGGELAAQLAIDAIRRSLNAGPYSSPEAALRAALEEANRVIVLRRQNPAFSAMGTTVVAAIISDDEVCVAYAGDSRAYVLRECEIQQLSNDHTYVQDLVERGVIDESDALNHPQAHVLTKCLGAEPRLEIPLDSYWIWPSENGAEDRLILCSDGLYSLVSDAELAEIFGKQSIQEGCVTAVEMAKARGGYDNITLAILPLGGQLREERTGKGASRSAAKRAALEARPATVPRLPELSTGKKVLLMMLLAFVGSMIAVLAVLLSLG